MPSWYFAITPFVSFNLGASIVFWVWVYLYLPVTTVVWIISYMKQDHF